MRHSGTLWNTLEHSGPLWDTFGPAGLVWQIPIRDSAAGPRPQGGGGGGADTVRDGVPLALGGLAGAADPVPRPRAGELPPRPPQQKTGAACPQSGLTTDPQ
eukprot:960190-Prorocentrum_minimum.AAC.1